MLKNNAFKRVGKMKNRGIFWEGVVLSLILGLTLTGTAFAKPGELVRVRTAIQMKGAHWTAGESWVTQLNAGERRRLLGEMTLEFGIVDQPQSPLIAPEALDAIDWRNKDGKNWITPIRDQSTCGSCVAFGSVATLESLARIEKNQPDMDIDLSEMHLFNCGGGSCARGWYNSAACAYLKDNGVPDEDCWPYQPVNQPCSNTCPDWRQRAVKISDYGNIAGINDCMTYVTIAPILVAFEVYTDFYYYTGGIYEYTWGEYEGGHAVSIVGYDTTGPIDYWIVKNSWGSSWGESGFFKIKMGECNIENRSSYWMAGVTLPDEPDLWDYCFEDFNYTPELQFNLEGNIIRGQAVLEGDPVFPSPLTGYIAGGAAFFSIGYRNDNGLRFYRIQVSSKTGETWGILDDTSDYYDTPHSAGLSPCSALLEQIVEGENGTRIKD